MSCPDTVYSPLGRAGIGVIQPQSGLDYPLVQPSEDIRYLLADFFLSVDDPGDYSDTKSPISGPLTIKYLYNVGCLDNQLPEDAPVPRAEDEADIVIVDAAGRVVMNTTAGVLQYSARDWTENYRIYEWITETATCRLVAYTAWLAGDDDERQYSRYLAPENATLDSRAVYKIPRRVLSLGVRQKTGELIEGPYVGDFILRNGYNTVLTPEVQPVVRFNGNTEITFAAEAGTGIGYYPVCEDVVDEETLELIPQPIRRINGIGGNQYGDFLMAATDCLYIRRPTIQPEPNVIQPSPTAQLQLGADCTPCCTCDEFVSVANYMKSVQEDYKKIGLRAGGVQQTHADNVEKWLEKVRCAISNPLKLVLVPQACPLVDVVIVVCNTCDECLPASRLTLNINQPATVVPGTTGLYAGNINGDPVPVTAQQGIDYTGAALTQFSIDMPPVAGGSSANFNMQLKFERRPAIVTGVLRSVGDRIKTGCPGITLPASRESAVATATVALYCDADGNTNRPS